MKIDRPPETPVTAPIGARALQLRLYREIGIAAVAAALDVDGPSARAPTPMMQRHTPATLEGKSLLARHGRAA